MLSLRCSLLLAAATTFLLPAPAARAGGPNIAVCMTLSNAYNQCVTDQRSRRPQPRGGGGYNQGYGGYGQGYDQGYGQGYGRGRGPYGQGYGQGYGGPGYGQGGGWGGGGWGGGGGGGWGDDDDEGYGYRRRPQRRPPPTPGIPYEQACANWLIQLKAAGCY